MKLTEFRYHFDALTADPNTGVIVQKISRLEKTTKHSHDFVEIAFVQSGRGWHTQNEAKTYCMPGTIYVINQEETHLFEAEIGNMLTVYNLILHTDFLGFFPIDGNKYSDLTQYFYLRTFQYKDFSHPLSVQFEQKELSLISDLFERMLTEYICHRPGFEELIRAWTIELLVYLFRKSCSDRDSCKGESAFKTEVLADVFTYIHQNYSQKIALTRLAEFAFVSPKYFSRLFKMHTGCTVSEYTQKLRIQHACSMLLSSNLSIAEVAAQIGYGDVKYFSAVFRRFLGISPTEYRCRNRQEKRR